MKTKIILTAIALPICCLLLCGALSAQGISRKVMQSFSPAVVNKMYADIASKMSLSEATQLWLCRAYTHRDSLVMELIGEGRTTLDNINRFSDSTGWAIELGLKEMMTPTELNEYKSKIEAAKPYPSPVYKKHIVPDAEMGSQFGVAIKLADQLKLRDTQADSILVAAAALRHKILFYKATPDSGYFDKAAFESAYLSKTLTENQYNQLLAEKNKDAATFQAKQDWYDLKAYGLAGKFQKDSTVKMMTVYNMIRAHVMDRFAHQKDRRATMLKAMRMPEPVKLLYQAKVGKTAELNKYAW